MKRLYFEELNGLTVNMDYVTHIFIKEQKHNTVENREQTSYFLRIWFTTSGYNEFELKTDEIKKHVENTLNNFRGD